MLFPVNLIVTAVAIFNSVSASPTSNARTRRQVARKATLYAGNAPRVVAAAAPVTSGNDTTFIVGDGDTLGRIAPAGVGICDIANANDLANPNILTPGQELVIPPPSATPDDSSCLPPAAPPASAGCVTGGPDRFLVPAAGLSAELAAGFLGITLDSFAAANTETFAAARAGDAAALAATNLTGSSILTVPVCPNSQCTISQGTVQEGDIFDAIAAAAGSTTGQILALNPGIDRLNLQIGQTFTLPSDCRNLTTDASNSSAVGA